ncbi:MAG: hypothetical protein EOP05_01315 [Proteobacteria bacterium]|nr:MAG: hypothetical protein EOP05_01315 [Pseudomonadota bacterium]
MKMIFLSAVAIMVTPLTASALWLSDAKDESCSRLKGTIEDALEALETPENTCKVLPASALSSGGATNVITCTKENKSVAHVVSETLSDCQKASKAVHAAMNNDGTAIEKSTEWSSGGKDYQCTQSGFGFKVTKAKLENDGFKVTVVQGTDKFKFQELMFGPAPKVQFFGATREDCERGVKIFKIQIPWTLITEEEEGTSWMSKPNALDRLHKKFNLAHKTNLTRKQFEELFAEVMAEKEKFK